MQGLRLKSPFHLSLSTSLTALVVYHLRFYQLIEPNASRLFFICLGICKYFSKWTYGQLLFVSSLFSFFWVCLGPFLPFLGLCLLDDLSWNHRRMATFRADEYRKGVVGRFPAFESQVGIHRLPAMAVRAFHVDDLLVFPFSHIFAVSPGLPCLYPEPLISHSSNSFPW